jgi:hypothetical protein
MLHKHWKYPTKQPRNTLQNSNKTDLLTTFRTAFTENDNAQKSMFATPLFIVSLCTKAFFVAYIYAFMRFSNVNSK